MSSHLLTSSSLLDTLAMSGSKKTTPLQQSPPSQTLSESVSNQRPIASIPTAQSLRATSLIGKIQEPDLPSSMDSVSKKVINSDFPTQGNLPDPVVITKSKVPQKSADAVTSHKAVKSSKRPHVAKSPSTTFNTRDLPGMYSSIHCRMYVYVYIIQVYIMLTLMSLKLLSSVGKKKLSDVYRQRIEDIK